ncbi:anti-anti-sigma factor [Mycolicibacterium duvalii]|uniref:Anti-anti-sigma factor n=1 Tax=Mycolicibacterium duvalii TaxID=39688 RepID=A0A7I7JYN9_9MYCO|nr:STAS domain-containing protein [Mycolicibacterium duvalii]MCV7369575.1 STAS domain-containing protein [Mycolicibacterium duvalii]PEG42199.1 anti-anti-sigma factor [Mycolicibacterium duvalii]BBX16301.1 anti-anti-sigma factor [Mycolicibacterium duvalii]
MPTSLSVDTTRSEDGAVIVIASGEVDLSNVDSFRTTLRDAAENSSEPITVDLSGVEYVDSGGINVLFSLCDRIGKVIAHPLLMTTFAVSGLTELTTAEAATY